MVGLQGTLEFGPGLEVLNIRFDEGALTSDHVNLTDLAAGRLGFAYTGELSEGAELLTLEIRSNASAELSEVLSLTDAQVYRESVRPTGASSGLTLTFTDSTEPAGANVLHQNIPNPVVSTTRIAFDLTQPGRTELQVRNVAGQLVLTRTLNATAGRNQIDLRAGEFGPAGVYTYTLSANGFTATRQLVLLR